MDTFDSLYDRLGPDALAAATGYRPRYITEVRSGRRSKSGSLHRRMRKVYGSLYDANATIDAENGGK